MIRVRRVATGVAIGCGVLYAGACLLASAVYPKVLYPARPDDPVQPPRGARVVQLQAADGVTVHAMEFPNASAVQHVVYFHGNGEVIGDDVWMAKSIMAKGFAVTLAEYRGYGRSAGAPPTEDGLYADATAVLDDLASRGVGPEHVILWGSSLGTGVAVEMARRGRGSALVLVSPYTSVVDMGAHFVPFLPVSLLMRDRFDTLAKAPSLSLPAVVVHGSDDELIPFSMGERVASAIRGARLERVEGGHHMDCFLMDNDLLNRVRDVVALR